MLESQQPDSDSRARARSSFASQPFPIRMAGRGILVLSL